MPSRRSDDPPITKRRVTMRNITLAPEPDEHGRAITITTEMSDYVRPDLLDAYVADARTRWQQVLVSEEPDAGPAGYHGQTFVSPDLDHPLAGAVFPASSGQED